MGADEFISHYGEMELQKFRLQQTNLDRSSISFNSFDFDATSMRHKNSMSLPSNLDLTLDPSPNNKLKITPPGRGRTIKTTGKKNN